LVGYTASKIGKIWNLLGGTIAEESGVDFDEAKVFDTYWLFGAAAIRIFNLPMAPFGTNTLPEINDIPHFYLECPLPIWAGPI
jgi:hypothetical protein